MRDLARGQRIVTPAYQHGRQVRCDHRGYDQYAETVEHPADCNKLTASAITGVIGDQRSNHPRRRAQPKCIHGPVYEQLIHRGSERIQGVSGAHDDDAENRHFASTDAIGGNSGYKKHDDLDYLGDDDQILRRIPLLCLGNPDCVEHLGGTGVDEGQQAYDGE